MAQSFASPLGSNATPDVKELETLVDVENGSIDRRIFWDEDIYRLELEKIFARCWLFVARGRDMKISVFLNSCPHRGNRVCYADAGNVRRFTCNYHGWSFGSDGRLLGMPAEELYEETCPSFSSQNIGLHPARVDMYKGLVFATFDEEAPSLEDYLGDFRWYLDILLDNDPDGTEFLDGNV